MKTLRRLLDKMPSTGTIDALAPEDENGNIIYGHRPYPLVVLDGDVIKIREEIEDLSFNIGAIEAALKATKQSAKSDYRDGIIRGLELALEQLGTTKLDLEIKH